ncbi:MAG: CoA ester lyase [Rhodospirillaceae bacterium]
MTFRTYLFVPADSPRKMERALQSGADALILDLEDSVAADRKDAARAEVARFLDAPAPMARFVRVNALCTGLTEADVASTAAARPDGYVLPKCEGPDDIETLSGLVDQAGGAASVRIMAIATESVRAVRRLMRENWSHPRLSALTWGGEDLSADMGASRNRDAGGAYLGPFQLARNLTLLAALEAGVEAIDAVYTDFANAEGLRDETAEARDLGFTGKLAIHPAQVAPIHDVFRPDPGQVEWARRVIAALAAAGGGVARLDGEMLDRPHLLQAQRILARCNPSL